MGEALPPPFVVGVLDSPMMILHILEPLHKSRTGFAEHRQPTLVHGTPGQCRSMRSPVLSWTAGAQRLGPQGPREIKGTQGASGPP